MSATAKVTLTVEVAVSSTWGDDCPISQIHKQAAEEAMNILRNHIGRVPVSGVSRITVLPGAKVEAIIVEGKR